jgi:hypothetical protein
MEKIPFASADTLVRVPFTDTVAKDTGSPFTPVTLPVAGSVWANTAIDKTENKTSSRFLMRCHLFIKKYRNAQVAVYPSSDNFTGFKKMFPASYKRTKDRKKDGIAVQFSMLN